MCELIADCPHSTAPDEGIGYPLIRTPNVGFVHLNLNGVHRVSESTYNKRNERAVPTANDLIFAREAPAGNIAVIHEGENVCLGQRTVLVRPVMPWVNSYYLAYYILSPSSQLNLVGKSTGTTVAHVNLSDFRPYIVALPPLLEQMRIVKRINDLLPYISHYTLSQKKVTSLNQSIYGLLKKSILQEAIQGKLVEQSPDDEPASVLLERIKREKERLIKEKKIKRDKQESIIYRDDDNKYFEKRGKELICIDDEIPFEIPDSWVWTRIENVVLLNPKNEADDKLEAAFIPMEKIEATYLSKYSYISKKWGEIKKGFTHFANGDVAFAKITPCFQNRKSMILEDLPNGIGAGTTELKVLRTIGNTILQEYLLFFLESPYFVDEATFKGTANQQRIVSGYLEKKVFPLPPLAEQQRIVKTIKSLWQVL